jgi:hypothetical protein
MSYFRRETYNQSSAILAFCEGLAAPHSVTITSDSVQGNKDGFKEVPAGLFVSKVGNVFRFLPRAVVTEAISTSSPAVKLNVWQLFKAGDVLKQVAPSATLTLITLAVGNTVALTGAGVTATYTAATTNTTTEAASAAIYYNNSVLSKYLEFVASGNTVVIYGKDNVTLHPLSVTSTGTATLSGSALVKNTTAVGTVQSFDTATGTVYLATNAAVALPLGAKVGVDVSDIVGLNIDAHDLTYEPRKHINVYTEAIGVYKDALPYFDGEIEAAVNNIRFRSKF